MKKLLIALLLSISLANVANAQTSITVDLNKAFFSWTWADTGDTPADGFRVLCGQTSGKYTQAAMYPADARLAPVRDTVPSLGRWFCKVVAFNIIGEGSESSELELVAGTVPFGQLTATIVVK